MIRLIRDGLKRFLLKFCCILDILQFAIFYILFLIIGKRNVVPNSILIIRVDSIGDYILFRNFIEILVNSSIYKGYSITLVGNKVWKDLSVALDHMFVDYYIWIDRRKFERNPIYRFKKLVEINQHGYEVVINSTYSRSFLIDDIIVKMVYSIDKIGSVGDLSNINICHKKLSDRFYTKLLQSKKDIIFEFYRNREFFENLLQENLIIERPSIKLDNIKLDIVLPKRYAVLFIGASARFRKWNVVNFIEIANYLYKEYFYEIVLCGGPTDLYDSKVFAQYYRYPYTDLVGKISLTELSYVISQGDVLVSNETVAPHIGIALGGRLSIFVISNGNHFGRFTPYPKEMADNYYPIYHPELARNLDSYKILANKYGYGSELDIDDISVDHVRHVIDSVLNSR